MKIFDKMQSFFNSIGEYVKNFSTLFYIFLGSFLLLSIVVIIITSFAYECKLTKTVDKINKFLERNPRINDDNLVAFNNLMKGRGVPKTLRRQWQQFMLYREHPASYYMSFQHCVENPMRNSTYHQQMTVYKIISWVLVVLSAIVSTFMAVQNIYSSLVLQDIVIIPLTILVMYWLISMVLDLVHNAISGDLFQNYQYFEINMDKAMLTLPEFVDYEVLFSQEEIRRGIPVLYAYLQKRAIQEQQELEKARLKSSDHEKFDFDKAGLDGSLVLDRAMRETENFAAQRKKYMQEIERVNNEIGAMENNYREMVKEYQRQVQTSKETVESLKEQLEQASSTIEINYIKKQMRDELSRQQVGEKEFDILTDKHNQSIKSLNQEIKHYEEETKKAKEALESAMLSEFNTYSVKVYNNLEKIVDDKMQDKVDEYKDQIKGLEGQIEEKNEELENVYTRYQEVLSQAPVGQEDSMQMYNEEDEPQQAKKSKKKKKNSSDDAPTNGGMTIDDQPQDYVQDYQTEQEYQDNYNYQDNAQYQDYNYDQVQPEYQDYSYDQQLEGQEYNDNIQTEQYDYQDAQNDYVPQEQGYEYAPEYQDEYIPADDQYSSEYAPLEDQNNGEYVPLNEGFTENYDYTPEYTPVSDEQPIENFDTFDSIGEYIPLNEEPINNYEADYNNNEYVPLSNETYEGDDYQEQPSYDTIPQAESKADAEQPVFNENDFDVDFDTSSNEGYDFDFGAEGEGFDFGENTDSNLGEIASKSVDEIEEEVDNLDINSILGLYDDLPKVKKDKKTKAKSGIEVMADSIVEETKPEETDTSFENNEPVKESFNNDNVDDMDDILPEPTEPKRKAGRPRKVIDEEDIRPKRKVGRPRKQVNEEAAQVLGEPKRRVGRPRKEVTDANEVPVKRKVGRPRKNKEDMTEQKRKVGRPRKASIEPTQAKRKVGRPRKTGIKGSSRILEAPKRKVGRPRKQELAKKKVGRPRKSENVIKLKRKVGRPRKNK